MTVIEDRDQEFHFAWEGAQANGPWDQLRVLEFHAREAISELYSFELDLFRQETAPDVDVEDLIDRRGALKLFTRTTSEWRIVHG